MGLTQGEKATIEKARRGGATELAVDLDDAACAYLLSVVVSDLSLHLDGLQGQPADFFSSDPERLRLDGMDFSKLVESAVELNRDVVTYFVCLTTLHKARLKYTRIVSHQPVPTIDQVGPRGLLQFGTMSTKALTGFLLWRKWMYDIDNRAAQETGYVFEPIIAHSIGGVPQSAKKSPIRRRDDQSKGRQVDCIASKRAYEFKLRVTIAASGQGRWKEELAFPEDCRASGYTPILIVFDPTINNKLTELQKAFKKAAGDAYVGAAAWKHLETEAGPTMARFLHKYVREPLNALLAEVPDGSPPRLSLSMSDTELIVQVGDEVVTVPRSATGEPGEPDPLPDDISDGLTGP